MANHSKYNTLDWDKLRNLAEYGHNDAFMSKHFGVALSTWNGWKVEHPEFKERLDEWKALANDKVRHALFECATGFDYQTEEAFKDRATGRIEVVTITKHVPPNPISQMFWLKCREGDEWQDRMGVQVEHNHKGTVNVSVKQQDLEDRIRRIASDAATDRVNQIQFGKEMENALQ